MDERPMRGRECSRGGGARAMGQWGRSADGERGGANDGGVTNGHRANGEGAGPTNSEPMVKVCVWGGVREKGAGTSGPFPTHEAPMRLLPLLEAPPPF